ncbi:glycosyltransferase family 4 protein [Candidatus Bathyarchaeota archaeon]|nr:glycosyltransferase family 4 protein [Candidatus Bathyarchaeota archaeon]
MHVLWFNWRCWFNPQAGGAEVHVREVAKRWVKLGHRVTLFCGKYDGCIDHEESDGVEIIRKGHPYTVYLWAAKQYLRSLKKREYDVVIDDINGVPFFTPLYVEKPKIALVHHLVKDIFFKELSWDKAIVGYTAEKMIPFIYHNIPFVTVSESTKRDLVQSGIPEANIRIIHNGIDQQFLKPKPEFKSPYPHLVYVGRIKRYKNLDQLLKVLNIVVNLLQKEARNRIRLTIAGRGDCSSLKKLAGRLGIDDHVEFLGEISDQEKVGLLQSAQIYVTTSIREGWGLTAMEAMACGTPVVGYNVPGLRDSVINGKTGLLVPYGNVEQLANAIITVLSNQLLEKELSQDARRWATKFDWDDTAKEFIKLLATVAKT